MLKEIRESRGMSQQDLAEKTGIPKRMIQAYEQGYRNINGAKLTTLLKLCDALECHLSEIVDMDMNDDDARISRGGIE